MRKKLRRAIALRVQSKITQIKSNMAVGGHFIKMDTALTIGELKFVNCKTAVIITLIKTFLLLFCHGRLRNVAGT